MNKRELIRLLAKQLLGTVLTKVARAGLYKFLLDYSYSRSQSEKFLKSRFEETLRIGLLKGYLELDVTEMSDENIAVRFDAARQIVERDAISLFNRQLDIFQQSTSIIANISALATLTTRNSWLVLIIASGLPFLDRLLQILFIWKNTYRRNSDFQTLRF